MTGNGRRKSFAVFRSGDLARVLEAYRVRYGDVPASVVVAPDQAGQAAAALARLGLATIPVGTSGGCLAGEVWAEINPAEAASPVDGKCDAGAVAQPVAVAQPAPALGAVLRQAERERREVGSAEARAMIAAALAA